MSAGPSDPGSGPLALAAMWWLAVVRSSAKQRAYTRPGAAFFGAVSHAAGMYEMAVLAACAVLTECGVLGVCVVLVWPGATGVAPGRVPAAGAA
jgi:hypothetical protein